MDSSKPIKFYDIAGGSPPTCFAPNPWKTRYALNFKQANYQTEWVEYPDVTSTRKRLGVAPNRKFLDGSDFYTLPIIEDLATGEIVGDSFDNAVYLDKRFPDRPTLIAPGTESLQTAFNIYVDAIFNNGGVVIAAYYMPFNPANEEESKAIHLKRSGFKSWEDIAFRGEPRIQAMKDLKGGLDGLAKAYRRSEGPFLEGATPIYSDFIVGGWFQMMKRAPEFEEILSWHDGLWGRLFSALEKYADVK